MRFKMNVLCKLFFVVLSYFSFGNLVEAEVYEGKIELREYVNNVYIKKHYDESSWRYETSKFIRRSEDNAFLYCLQIFNAVDSNQTYHVVKENYSNVLNISKDNWERIRLLAYYGYGYDNHTDDRWYSITQVLIWKTLFPETDIYFTDTLNGKRNDELFKTEINELESLVSLHNTYPKLKTDEKIYINKTTIIEDTNQVLNNYKIVEMHNIDAKIENNSLILNANTVGNAKIKLLKKDNFYSDNPIVYYSDKSQNVLKVGSYDPIELEFEFNIIGAKVEIYKKDNLTGNFPQGNASLSGAIYGIYDSETNKLINTLTTNDKNYAISDYLPYLGSYYLQEISPSEGYNLDSTKYYFNVDKDNLNISLSVYEEVIKKHFEITKILGTKKTEIVTPEVNVLFGIYDNNDNLIFEKYTDNNGKIIFELPYGEYILRQLTVSQGYEKIEDYAFKVIDNQSETLIFSNAPIQAKVKIIKTDQNGNTLALKDIKFKIKNIDTNEYVCQTLYLNEDDECIFKTNENGIILTPYPLAYGNYQIEEVDQKITNYVWNSKPLKFTIDENSSDIIELKFSNSEVRGKIEIIKNGEKLILENNNYTYESIKLANVKFNLYDENGNKIDTLITNSSGYATIDNLKLGKYFLKEVLSSKNNTVDPKYYSIDLSYEDQYTPVVEKKLIMNNYLGKGTVKILKTDSISKQPLSNVQFNLYTTDNKLIYSGITNNNGELIINNLYYEKFYIIEENVPLNYRLNSEKIYFEINKNNKFISINVENDRIVNPETYDNISEYIIIFFISFFSLFVIIFIKKY